MSENKSFLESVVDHKKPESFEQETFVQVNNNKTVKLLMVALILIVLIIVGFNLFSISQKVEMKDFVGYDIADASVWAQKNGMILVAKSVYNFDHAEGIVLEQDVPAGQTLKKNETFTLQVSAGADPEDLIPFPDIMRMNADEIDAWIDSNKLTGIQFNTRSSSLVGVDQVIEYSFTDGKEDNFQRKNRVVITLSSGPTKETDTVVVTDFTTMNQGKVLRWGIENDIPITIEEVYSKYFAAGEIISQSIQSGEEILKNDSITVVVSLGQADTVPDFSNLSMGTILKWGSDNAVNISIVEVFSNYISSGSVISQSIKSGSEIISGESIIVRVSLGKPVIVLDFSDQTIEEAMSWAKLSGVNLTTIEMYDSNIPKGKMIKQSLSKDNEMKMGDEIKIYYSLGKVDVTSYIGKSKLDMLAWQSEVNSKGANITLKFTEAVGSKGTIGKIINQSIIDNQVATDTTISVTVSKGATVMVPDFSGLTELECTSLANGLGLNVQYQYVASTSIDQGYLIKQIPSKGKVIGESEKITLMISLSEVTMTTVVVPDFLSMKASEILAWGSDNDIKIQLYGTYNSFVSSGSVVSQSVPKSTIIDKGSTIQVGISEGKAPVVNTSTVPNFGTMSEAEATTWAKNAGVSLSIVSKYSDIYAKGLLHNQSLAVGTGITSGEGMLVTVSLGKVSIANFVGKTKLDVLNWQQEVNSKGANVTVNFNIVAGGTGLITSQSKTNDFILINESINFDLAE